MSIDVLGSAVNDDVRAQLQWLLEIRAGKGVIHDDQQVVSMGNLCDCRNIYQPQEWIGRRLQPDHFRVAADSLLIGCYITCRYIAGLDGVATHDALENTIAPTIEIVARND